MTIATKQAQPFARNHLIRDASWQAVYDAMRQNPSVYVFGEGAWVKAHYDAPQILKEFPDRIVTMPISEDGNVNFAVGASLLGVKPVVDVITADFLYRAMDSIANTAAKVNFVRPDQPPSTIVIRAEFLTGGPTTGQRPEALFTHIPGLNVVIPSNARDAYGLMLTALDTPGVTLFFEDRMIRDDLITQHNGPLWLAAKTPIPLGCASWRKRGLRSGVTVVSYGLMLQQTEQVLSSWKFDGDYYSENNDLGVDLIDLRSIYPLDWNCIRKMLERTGRLLIIEPDVQYAGIGAEIAATIAEVMPEVRVKRLGGKRATIPAAQSLHGEMMPTEEQIVDAVSNW